jgi:hypothetical protein
LLPSAPFSGMIALHGLNLPVGLSDSRTTIHPSKFKIEKEMAPNPNFLA